MRLTPSTMFCATSHWLLGLLLTSCLLKEVMSTERCTNDYLNGCTCQDGFSGDLYLSCGTFPTPVTVSIESSMARIIIIEQDVNEPFFIFNKLIWPNLEIIYAPKDKTFYCFESTCHQKQVGSDQDVERSNNGITPTGPIEVDEITTKLMSFKDGYLKTAIVKMQNESNREQSTQKQTTTPSQKKVNLITSKQVMHGLVEKHGDNEIIPTTTIVIGGSTGVITSEGGKLKLQTVKMQDLNKQKQKMTKQNEPNQISSTVLGIDHTTPPIEKIEVANTSNIVDYSTLKPTKVNKNGGKENRLLKTLKMGLYILCPFTFCFLCFMVILFIKLRKRQNAYQFPVEVLAMSDF